MDSTIYEKAFRQLLLGKSTSQAVWKGIIELLKDKTVTLDDVIDRFKSVIVERDIYSDQIIKSWFSKFLCGRTILDLYNNKGFNKNDVEKIIENIDCDYELHELLQNNQLLRLCFKLGIDFENFRGIEIAMERSDEENAEISLRFYDYELTMPDEFSEHQVFKDFNNIYEVVSILWNEDNGNDPEIVFYCEIYQLDKFSSEQKSKLIEVLEDNEIAKNRLKEIIDNHLEDTYDFDTLKNILTKDTRKRNLK